MQTLFGLPLFGSLFTPILITLVSVLLYKTFFRMSKVEISNEPMNIKPVDIKDSLENDETKTTVKKKKKKACSGKKGGKGCCSDKNGIIDITKVFVESSSLTKDHSESLTNLWSSDSLNVEVVPLNSDNLEAQLKEETGSVSLCVFLLDKNEKKPVLRPWLDSVSKRSPTSEKLLAGFKYSVFVANGNDKDLIHLETDRALHRLGGVRVCKAGIADFSTWLESLSRTVSKWNESGKKGCKCGPTSDSGNEHEGEHSSCSGSCSSSEDDASAPLPPPVLDLEDLGKALS